MAEFQAFNGLIEVGDTPPGIFNLLETTDQLYLMNDANDYLAVVITPLSSGTIDSVDFRTLTVTTGDDLHISFQDLDSIGDPDGVEDEFRVVTIGDANDDTYFNVGLITSDGTDTGTKRTVSVGVPFAVVFRFNSYVAGNLNISTGAVADASAVPVAMVKTSSNAGTSWTRSNRLMNLAVKYDNGYTYMHGLFPWKEIVTGTTASADSPDELGMRFRLPFALTTIGFIFPLDVRDGQFSIEAANGSVLMGPLTFLPESDATTSNAPRRFFSTATLELTEDTDYYIVWKPNTVTARNRHWVEVDSAQQRACWPFGEDQSMVERTDGGAWTETDTQLIPFSLLTTGFFL